VYVQPPRSRGETSIKNITVPFLLVLAGGGMLFSSAFWLAGTLTTIQNSIDNLRRDLNGYISTVSERIGRVESELDKLKTNRWTIKDHDLWCAREEVVNPNWKCVPSTTTGSNTPPSVDSWRGNLQRE
jgi:hypothetical protein